MVVTDSAGLVIADDIRRAAMKQLKCAELEHWRSLAGNIPQGTLAGDSMVELGRAVLQGGTAKQQCTFCGLGVSPVVARPAAVPQVTGSSPQAVNRFFWEPHCGLQRTILVHVH